MYNNNFSHDPNKEIQNKLDRICWLLIAVFCYLYILYLFYLNNNSGRH